MKEQEFTEYLVQFGCNTGNGCGIAKAKSESKLTELGNT
jgi:hypothetical protein